MYDGFKALQYHASRYHRLQQKPEYRYGIPDPEERINNIHHKSLLSKLEMEPVFSHEF